MPLDKTQYCVEKKPFLNIKVWLLLKLDFNLKSTNVIVLFTLLGS